MEQRTNRFSREQLPFRERVNNHLNRAIRSVLASDNQVTKHFNNRFRHQRTLARQHRLNRHYNVRRQIKGSRRVAITNTRHNLPPNSIVRDTNSTLGNRRVSKLSRIS